MALLISTWDLPIGGQIEAYNEKSKTWVQTIMKQKGLKEFRAYRNPYHASPGAMVHIEFDSVTSCMKYIESEDYARIISEMRAVGCSNLAVQLWGPSPLIPEPLRPTAA